MSASTGTPLLESIQGLFTTGNALLLAGGWISFKVLEALYNVSPLHPLSHIPGPKLAAASYWPEFYHDVILFGRYTGQIRKWHEQYGKQSFSSSREAYVDLRLGPIVRISPHEVHCNDVGFVDEIFAVGGRKRDKPRHQINGSAYVAFDLHWLTFMKADIYFTDLGKPVSVRWTMTFTRLAASSWPSSSPAA